MLSLTLVVAFKYRAALTLIAGNKKPQKASQSALDDDQVDDAHLQRQLADGFSCGPRRTGDVFTTPRGATQVASSFEGLHDNCRDTAQGLYSFPRLQF